VIKVSFLLLKLSNLVLEIILLRLGGGFVTLLNFFPFKHFVRHCFLKVFDYILGSVKFLELKVKLVFLLGYDIILLPKLSCQLTLFIFHILFQLVKLFLQGSNVLLLGLISDALKVFELTVILG